MTKKERRKVFDKYGGRCAYCGCELQKSWHMDHLEPIRRNIGKPGCIRPENENTGNYMPSCASCNINKHSDSLEEFRRRIKAFINSLNSYSVQYKIAKRYGLLTEIDKPVIFYFETLKSNQ